MRNAEFKFLSFSKSVCYLPYWHWRHPRRYWKWRNRRWYSEHCRS